MDQIVGRMSDSHERPPLHVKDAEILDAVLGHFNFPAKEQLEGKGIKEIHALWRQNNELLKNALVPS